MTLPKHIHFIGIGGIGVSGLAKLMAARGVVVSGSDESASDITREVASLGIPVMIGHKAENVAADCDLVVYSEAVPGENPERVEAAKRNVRRLSAAEFIGEWTADMRTVAVSGTNGKSTTTALLGLILERAGMDPTVIVGSKVPAFPLGNVRVGKSDLVVLEADEYRAKYLNYRPAMIVLTNVEEDHLDFFTGLPEIAETFDKYLDHLKPGGTLILNNDDLVSTELHATIAPVTYGIANDADFRATDIRTDGGVQTFEVAHEGKSLGVFTLRVPAKYNVANALAALAAAVRLGVPVETVRAALSSFGGIWRRFEVAGEWKGATIVSDYGHHPTAIKLTVTASREFFPGRRIVLVFQPHQHSRTLHLFDDFVAALQTPDLAIVSDIFHVVGRGGEEEDISSADLVATAERPGTVVYGGPLAETRRKMEELVKSGDVVLMMGAGDIDSLARELVGEPGARSS